MIISTVQTMKWVLLFSLLCWAADLPAQKQIEQDWNAFYQSVDVTSYQGGTFRFTGFIRAESTILSSNARIWARVDKKKGMGFFDNMQDRPVTKDTWQEYAIEGPLDDRAVKLLVGGLYLGSGKYYFDNFALQLKKKDGTWEDVALKDPGFESDSVETRWKSFYSVIGYKSFQSAGNGVDGSTCLAIDGSGRKGGGKEVAANGINIYYEEYGQGDTLLLLHGNSESIRSFSRQIPELSKYFHVIAMDSRGQGNTSRDDKKITYELMAQDVNAFLDALHIRQVKLLGWSDGGIIGLILAMEHPDKVKRLATMGANLFNNETSVDPKINKILRTERARLVKEDSEKHKFRLEMIDLLLNEPQINPESLKKVACPTLVMAGSKDVIKEEHTRLIAGKIPTSELLIFDKGTHYEPSENPDRFNKAVIAFFNKR